MTFRNIALFIFLLAILASVISRQTGRDLGLMDTGPGMATCSGILLLFLWLSKVKTIQDLKRLNTPSRIKLLLLLNFSGLLALASIVFYMAPTQWRIHFLVYDPSITPLIAGKFFDMYLVFIPLNLLGFLLSAGSRYPASLLRWPVRYNLKSTAWEVLFCILVLIVTAGLVRMMILGMHEFILAGMVLLYVILSLRAGQMYRFVNINDHAQKTIQPESHL